VARSRKLEAFRTLSALFVHDLKNKASSLNLMLKNLPIHFDDPGFGRAPGAASAMPDQVLDRILFQIASVCN
jgi:hypothetical protein